MSNQNYVVPQVNQSGFTCPHCNVFSNHKWYYIVGDSNVSGRARIPLPGGNIAVCDHCKLHTMWNSTEMVYPRIVSGPVPAEDMPDDVKSDYEEARKIVSLSPKGAAALLRLAVQKLCKHLGEEGNNINTDIASLVQKGLNPRIQQALDIVRVVGNNAVHPGQIDVNDNPELVHSLFGLINVIVEAMITQPRVIEEIYNSSLPENARLGIQNRDA